jgi:hypothetical protein
MYVLSYQIHFSKWIYRSSQRKRYIQVFFKRKNASFDDSLFVVKLNILWENSILHSIIMCCVSICNSSYLKPPPALLPPPILHKLNTAYTVQSKITGQFCDWPGLSTWLSNCQLWSWRSVKEILCLLGYVSVAQARKTGYSSEHWQCKEEALATLVEIRS